MQYIDDGLLHLHDLHTYIYDDIKRKWAEVYEEEIRAKIAKAAHLSAVPHLKAQLAADRPLWEILSLVDLYEEQLPAALEARDVEAAALVAEAVPELQRQNLEFLDFCSLYPMPDRKSAYVGIPTSFAQEARLVLQGLEMDGALELQEPIWWELTRQGAGYRLSFLTDAFEMLELDFDGLQLQRQFYHAGSCCGYVENPWLLLSGMAEAILEKNGVDPTLLNEKEQALLPMLKALCGLEGFWLEDGVATLFAPLQEQLRAQGLIKAAVALETFCAAPENKRESRRQKLLHCLRQTDCEALWRQLYTSIMESQSGLPFATQEDSELVPKRQAVTNALHEMGFQGQYPFFWQEGPKKGVALMRSYDQDYTVMHEPHGFYMVQALEAPLFGKPDIYFVAGTVFVKKKDYFPGMCPDIFTAMFEEKGRRSYQNLLTVFSDLSPADAAIIAGKKARLEKLSKAERKSLVQFPVVGILFLCLLMGLFFGVSFTLLFGLFVALILLIGGELGAFWEIPWLGCFLFCTVAFGVGMAVVMLLQRRK